MRRIVDNLLSNAIKYTPAGGSVRVTAKQRGESVEVAVTDTGIGLTEEEQQHAVPALLPLEPPGGAPGARDRPRAGAGPGVDPAGGRADPVKSQVGKGSTFTVTIPPLAPTEGAPTGPGIHDEVIGDR